MMLELTFVFENETKTTFRFKEVFGFPEIGTLYSKRSTFAVKAPGELTFEITYGAARGPGAAGSRGRDAKVLRSVVQEGSEDYPDYACPDDPDGLHHIGCGCE